MPRTRGQLRTINENLHDIRIFIGEDANGKRHIANKRVRCSREEAERIRQEAIDRVDEGSTTPFGFNVSLKDVSATTRIKLGATGAVSEMMVCIDLLRRGYDVYRSVAACGACDLIALRYGSTRAHRIEVKTVQKRGKALVFNRATLNPAKYDIVAMVSLRDGSISYLPELSDLALAPE